MDQTSGAYRSTSSFQARSSDPAARATSATTDGSSRMGDSRNAGAALGSALAHAERGAGRQIPRILAYLPGRRKHRQGAGGLPAATREGSDLPWDQTTPTSSAFTRGKATA